MIQTSLARSQPWPRLLLRASHPLFRFLIRSMILGCLTVRSPIVPGANRITSSKLAYGPLEKWRVRGSLNPERGEVAALLVLQDDSGP